MWLAARHTSYRKYRYLSGTSPCGMQPLARRRRWLPFSAAHMQVGLGSASNLQAMPTAIDALQPARSCAAASKLYMRIPSHRLRCPATPCKALAYRTSLGLPQASPAIGLLLSGPQMLCNMLYSHDLPLNLYASCVCGLAIPAVPLLACRCCRQSYVCYIHNSVHQTPNPVKPAYKKQPAQDTFYLP